MNSKWERKGSVNPRHAAQVLPGVEAVPAGLQGQPEQGIGAKHHGATDGVVEVQAQVHENVFTLTVTNQGNPIAPHVQAQLFQPYSRPANHTPQAGLGLGLYIASQIAQSHGGRLEVDSSAAHGTVFSFHLPLRAKQ